MTVGEIHSVRILKSGNYLRAVLYLQVGLEHFNVVKLTLLRSRETSALVIQREVTVVGLDELMDGGKHSDHGGNDSSRPSASGQLGESLKAE